MTNRGETIPAGPDELSASWLTAALRDVGVVHSGSIADLAVEVIGTDRGFTGVVARVQLVCDRSEPGLPTNLVAKFPLAQPAGSTYRDAQQATAEQFQQYWERCAREIRFYRELARESRIAPHVYGAWSDRERQRMLLLIEDLSDGEPGDALTGCSVERAALVIDQLAAFHAHSWQRTDREDLGWLPRWGSDPRTRSERFRRQLEGVLEHYGERIPAPVSRLARQIADGYESNLRELAGSPMTIVHGDLHLDNLMFMRDQRTSMESVTVLDWQSVAAGPAITDLSLFLVGSLSVEDRRTAASELLVRYHRSLTWAGVRGYTMDDLKADYVRSLAWQLAGIVGWLARIDLTSLAVRERALVEAIFSPGQVFAACADHADQIVASLR